VTNLFYIRTGTGSIVFVLLRVFSLGIVITRDGSHILFNLVLWKLELTLELGVK
tara:strand:- start:22442 stop:22603 length:162 start_codon:yes stop_codon:yes gene_type:complete